MTIQAIDTAYQGYLFRSRNEARWAVFLDCIGLKWKYETEGFELPSGRYLPDFYLKTFDCWLEIKPESPTQAEQQKCEELAVASGKPVAVFWGLPGESAGLLYVTHEGVAICGMGIRFSMTAPKPCFTAPAIAFPLVKHANECETNPSRITSAAKYAKAARFEFGQTPQAATEIKRQEALKLLNGLGG